MIRSHEIVIFLASVRSAIADELRPELQSAHAKAMANSSLLTLDRVIVELAKGDEIAGQRSETWAGLRKQARSLGFPLAGDAQEATGLLSKLDVLQADMGDLQKVLNADAGFDALRSRLTSREKDVAEWFAQAADANADLTFAYSPAPIKPVVEKTDEKSSDADEPARLRKGLNAYLKARFPELPEEPVTALRLSPGGYVKQTALFSLVPNAVLPTKLVLRRDLAHSITGSAVKDEYPVIDQAFNLGMPVPRPILLETDPAVLGSAFMLMTEVEAASPSGPYFPEERNPTNTNMGPNFGKQVAQALALLHSKTRLQSAATVPDYKKLVEESHATWQTVPVTPYGLGMELGYAWLLSHPLSSNRPWCMVHGDFGAHNILARDGELAGVVDWELAHPGDPAEDIAQCRMMMLPGIMEWEEFVKEYVAAGGDPTACDPAAIGYFCVWIYVKHCVWNVQLRNTFLAGQRSDVNAAAVTSHYNTLLTMYLADALKIAVASQR